MLLGDSNRSILLSDSHVVISRKNSVIRYSMEYTQIDIWPVAFSLPRCFNGKIYDYLEDKIVLFSSDDFRNTSTREFHGGNPKDYYKFGNCFYFIKSCRNGSSMLFSREPQSTVPRKMLAFQSQYCFDDEFIFTIKNGMVVKTSLRTLNRSVVGKTVTEPLIMCCRAMRDASEDLYPDDMVAYTDARNRLHIHHGKEYRSYHWLSNKAESLCVHDDYVIAASKSGDVVRFHSRIHRIEPLFRFDGEFVDMKIRDNKIYLLSALQFFVFDLESQGLVHKETLVVPADYKVCNIQSTPPKDNSNDIFGLARQSRVEIFNSLENYNHYSNGNRRTKITTNGEAPRAFIAYTYRRCIYLFDPVEKTVVSQFLLDSDTNFISNGKVLAFIHKRASMVARVFSVFQDRLVLDGDRMILSKDCAKISNAYYVQNKIFVEISNSLCYINRLNLIETLNKGSSPLNLKEEDGSLFIIDEKGVFNVLKHEYILKQKRSTNFCVFKGSVVFFIEDRGIYVDLPERKQILEIRNIIDIKSEVVCGKEVLRIIHLVDGRCRIEDYALNDEGECASLEKVSERAAENSCFRILCNDICATKANQLIIT